MNNYEKFYAYLQELLQSYTRLAELLKEKLEAVAHFNIEKLDSIIKQEQVFVLVSKGFDSNIQSYREKLSLTGDSLSAVIEELPPEEQNRFRSLAKELRMKLDEVKGLNHKCQSMIEERLYSLDKAIKELDKSDTTAYGKAGAAKPGQKADTRLFTKSI